MGKKDGNVLKTIPVHTESQDYAVPIARPQVAGMGIGVATLIRMCATTMTASYWLKNSLYKLWTTY